MQPLHTFYDDHPFDYLSDSPIDLLNYRPLLLQKLLLDKLPGKVVIDVGCGPGNDIGYAASVRTNVIGFDLSLRSLYMMRSRYSQTAVCADNQYLPVNSCSVDCCISSGVLHHTINPKTAFEELARVVKPGGYLYLAIYKPKSRYWLLYTFIGGVLRILINKGGSLGRILAHSTVLPLYWLAHKLKSRGRRSWSGAKNLFYDYFITPIVHFLPPDEVGIWAKDLNLVLTNYEIPAKTNVQCFVFRRES